MASDRTLAGDDGDDVIDNPAVEALRRQLRESLYPTLAAAVGVGFVLAGSGRSELGKLILRYAGGSVAGPTLRMIAATLAKIDPGKARAALDLEARLDEPVDVHAALAELRRRDHDDDEDGEIRRVQRRGPSARRH